MIAPLASSLLEDRSEPLVGNLGESLVHASSRVRGVGIADDAGEGHLALGPGEAEALGERLAGEGGDGGVEGLPVTSPERTIVDSLEAGVQPEQVEMAIGQALERGLTTPRRLTEAASGRSARVRKFFERRLEEVPA